MSLFEVKHGGFAIYCKGKNRLFDKFMPASVSTISPLNDVPYYKYFKQHFKVTVWVQGNSYERSKIFQKRTVQSFNHFEVDK